MRGVKRVDSSADLARILDDGTTPAMSHISEDVRPPKLTWRQNLIKLVTGIAPGEKATPESPTARLKLLLIISFLALHALNLLSTLTANTALTRHLTATAESTPRIDIATPTVAPVLSALAALHSTDIALVVHIAAPLFLQLSAPGLATTTSSTLSSTGIVPLALLDRFMTAWSQFVGDPVLSKWIVIALAISVFLNGYLLKGITVGANGGQGLGFAPVSAAEAAARILVASTRSARLAISGKREGSAGSGGEDEDDERPPKMRRRWSGGIESLPRMQTWTLAEAAELALERRDEMVERERQRDRAARRRGGSQSSEDSEPPSPIFVKPRSRRPTVQGSLISSDRIESVSRLTPLKIAPGAEDNSSSTPNLTASKHPTIAVTSSTPQEPNVVTLADETTTSETSSDLSALTPATTVDDDELPTPGLPSKPRSIEECIAVYDGGSGAPSLLDEELIMMVQRGKIAAYALEKLLKDHGRAVYIRRALICKLQSVFYRNVLKPLNQPELLQPKPWNRPTYLT